MNKTTLRTLKHSISHTFARKQTCYALSRPHPSINACLTYQINKPHEKGVCVHIVGELRATGQIVRSLERKRVWPQVYVSSLMEKAFNALGMLGCPRHLFYNSPHSTV